MIIRKNGKYYVKSESGDKNLGGPYSSHEDAVARLKQVEWFKNKPKTHKKKQLGE